MRKIANIKFYTHEDWLNMKHGSIGGTGVATILGKNKYESRISLWRKMVGIDEPTVMNDAMMLGIYLESGVAEYTIKAYNAKNLYTQKKIMVAEHIKYPYIIGSPDRVVRISGQKMLLEIKTTKKRIFNVEEDCPHWIIQANHYCGLLGIKNYIISYLSYPAGSIDFYEGSFNKELFDYGVEACVDFYSYVVNREMPEPLTGGEVEDYINYIPNTKIIASDEVLLDLAMANKYSEEEKEAKKTAEYYRDKIKLFVMENEVLVSDDDKLATFKTVERDKFNMNKFKEKYPEIYLELLSKESTRMLRINHNFFK